MKKKTEVKPRYFKKDLRSRKLVEKEKRFLPKPIGDAESSKIVAKKILLEQTSRFLLVLSGCLTKCGNKRRAITTLSKALFDYTVYKKQAGTAAPASRKLEAEEKMTLPPLVESLLPTLKNRKQHMGRKVHFIPLPFQPKERVNAPVKFAVHWFYQSLLKNRTPTKLRSRLVQELQSVDHGTSEVLKKKIATYRTAIDAKPSIRFYRFLKKL